MTSASSDEGERYEHVGTITPTSRLYRGVYQFTNEPTLVHLVEWYAEITLCGLPRESFIELDPVFQVDEFPSCDECRELANWRILERIINRQSALRRQATREVNRDDSINAPKPFDDLITRMSEILHALRDAIVDDDRETYILTRGRWQSVEAELDELLPQKPEPLA